MLSICFVRTCNHLAKLWLMKLCLLLGLTETITFSFWLHPWACNRKYSLEIKPLLPSWYFFITRDHTFKNIYSNSSCGNVLILSWLRDFHNTAMPSLEKMPTRIFHTCLDFIYCRYLSMVWPSSFTIKKYWYNKNIKLWYWRKSLFNGAPFCS